MDESLIARVRPALHERLDADHVAHSERTAALARDLAVSHGVDPGEAELAGLLHDWSREESGPELVADVVAAGGAVCGVEKDVPHLLHARAAAVRLRADFPELPESVLDAIEHHTLGAVGLSDLGKIVYIADMIEEGRAYAGVEDLRAAVRDRSLDDAFREAYSRSLRYLIDAGKPIHPATVDVWNWLVRSGSS